MTASRLEPSLDGDASARADLFSAIDAGAGLVTFVGHGGVQTWGGEPYLSNADVATLSNDRYPIVASFDCLNALFDHPSGESLAEALLRADAGAAAVWAPSSITAEAPHAALLQTFQASFWRRPGMRLGDVVSESLASIAWRTDAAEALGTFVLLGDPALKHNVNRAPRSVATRLDVGDLRARFTAAASSDEDGDPLTYQWEIALAPEGATATLEGAGTADATLIVSAPGRYIVRLRAADPHRAGPPDDVAVELRAADSGSGPRGGCAMAPTTANAWPLVALLAVALVAVLRRRR